MIWSSLIAGRLLLKVIARSHWLQHSEYTLVWFGNSHQSSQHQKPPTALQLFQTALLSNLASHPTPAERKRSPHPSLDTQVTAFGCHAAPRLTCNAHHIVDKLVPIKSCVRQAFIAGPLGFLQARLQRVRNSKSSSKVFERHLAFSILQHHRII